MGEVAVVYHEDFLKHATREGHPESPERLKAIMNGLATEGLLRQLTRLSPTVPSEEMVTLVHSPKYVRWVEERCSEGAECLDRGDTVVCEDSFHVALLAVGATIAASDWVMKSNGRRAFCAVRPPGHHAEAERAMGFCIFNNVAICARYLQKHHGVGKVLIVDWDVHHGNGTQNAFYGDPSVFYFSVHEYPFYPGTGRPEERGVGEGEGHTMNVPLRAGSDDEEFTDAFRARLVPAAARFRPDIVLISAGFDAHLDDPMAAMCMTENGFAALTAIVRGIADRYGNGRIISVLEGGYHLSATPASVVRHVQALQT
jgi:acetoin utilization deacetylase AcuC-like enzyme